MEFKFKLRLQTPRTYIRRAHHLQHRRHKDVQAVVGTVECSAQEGKDEGEQRARKKCVKLLERPPEFQEQHGPKLRH